jgi:hypothetical protein
MFLSEWKDGFEGMVKKAWELLDEADAVIHYNGVKFDLPTLNREFLMLGMTPPTPYVSIDLYTTVRSKFRFVSNKLDFVCRELGIGAKTQHKGFRLWTGCMDGDPDSLATMEEYNIQDIALLTPLYTRLRPWIRNHPNVALYDENVLSEDGTSPLERRSCTKCGSLNLQSRGYKATTTQVYRQFRCNDCGSWSRERHTAIPASLRKGTLTEAGI